MTETTTTKKNTKKESFVAETGRTHTIDAAGKRLGKVATEAATVLMGKDQATFTKHIMSDVLDHLKNRLGIGEVLQRTIGGMLPNNKHKKRLLKQVIITE